METAKLDPDGGERPRDPGDTALADRDTGFAGGGNNGQDGASDPGATGNRKYEGSWTRSGRGSGNARAGRDEGPESPGTRINEGSGSPGARVAEGSGSPGTRIAEGSGSPGAGVAEGSGSPGAGVAEGSGSPGAGVAEGSRSPGAGVAEGSRSPGAGFAEGAGSPGAGVVEGAGSPGARVNDGSRSPGIRGYEGNGSPGAGVNERSRSSELWGPGIRVDEGPWDVRARCHEGSRDVRPITCEGARIPGGREHEATDSTRANAEEQWVARPGGSEGPCASQPCGERGSTVRISGYEGSVASGTRCSEESSSSGTSSGEGPDASGNKKLSSTSKQLSPGPIDGEVTTRTSTEDGSHDTSSAMERTTDTRGSESFKKPVFPARPIGNEKAAEPRSKPSPTSSNPSSSLFNRATSRETTTNVSTGLPSDAYRASPAIPYREPSWSGLPTSVYCLEMLKGGSIICTKSLNNTSWTVFGRLPECHVSLEHPSVSRYHAVLQYRQIPGSEPDEEPGFYIYDLGSTHGTYLNKQKIQPKTYCRFRVGHVLKFGGSTRLFILQGPEDDQEAESELTVTQIKEARRQREELQKKMLGDDSDEEEDISEEGKRKTEQSGSGEEGGCMWGMGEDALEEDNDVNPIAVEFQEERESLYLKDPKKALQGFFDREGEELEYEYEERGPGTWLCRVTLPVDDASGKPLVAETIHSGKKKDAAKLCSLEACRILDTKGLLRQEAVSRKRKAKQWEDQDFYDSDDDTFLDRTGLVEKKRLNRMKKAGKIEEKPETYDSLVAKLNLVEKELGDIATKLHASHTAVAQSTSQDSLDAFMTEIKSGGALDAVSRKKLHLQSFELKKEQQRLKGLIKIVQPTKLPELSSVAQDTKSKKLMLPMFGAMKGGSKYKLKTGTVGRLPPKRIDLPDSFFSVKEKTDEPEEEEEEEEEEVKMQVEQKAERSIVKDPENTLAAIEGEELRPTPDVHLQPSPDSDSDIDDAQQTSASVGPKKHPGVSDPNTNSEVPSKFTVTKSEEIKPKSSSAKQKRMYGPSRPPQGVLSTHYPEDDPDYCVWTPPTGQTGDGKTHLNEKYGY
ncbi:kanadaptin [Rhinophrynus dorsalis]